MGNCFYIPTYRRTGSTGPAFSLGTHLQKTVPLLFAIHFLIGLVHHGVKALPDVWSPVKAKGQFQIAFCQLRAVPFAGIVFPSGPAKE